MQLTESNQKAVTDALKVMDRHFPAINEHNALAPAATLHFLRFRPTGTSLKVWWSADSCFDGPKDCAQDRMVAILCQSELLQGLRWSGPHI